jgi:hypothetical protein
MLWWPLEGNTALHHKVNKNYIWCKDSMFYTSINDTILITFSTVGLDKKQSIKKPDHAYCLIFNVGLIDPTTLLSAAMAVTI